MKMRRMTVIGLLAGAVLLGGGPVRADKELTYQEKLEKEQAQIDTAVMRAGGTIAKNLADRFALKPEELQKIRDGGFMANFEGRPGWGDITIMLSMAGQLAKTHPANYPTYEKALEKVLNLRVENTTYEKIAKQLELNLQPVLAETKHIRKNLQSEKRLPAQRPQ